MSTQITEQIQQKKLIAIIRVTAAFDIVPVAEALVEGGISMMEVTLNSHEALKKIRLLADRFSSSDVLVGAGTVLSREDVQKVYDAGAQFIVTPATPVGLIAAAYSLSIPVLAGAYTPLEILNAHNEGADMVKLFPAEPGGLSYMKAIKGPLPHIPLVPTGGITADNAATWLKAGASALGIGSALVSEQWVKEKKWRYLAERATAFTTAIVHNNHSTA
jgi:2-dehydro-3-deoxyphosphogluconate aldolase/(4S)-4-hydroxy-2-oxoglutarate aldolase